MSAERLRCGPALALCMALALAPVAAEAQFYRCVTKDGRTIYGEVIPAACVGLVVEQLNPQGIVLRRIDPPLTPEQRAAKAAEEQKRREEAEAARVQARRDHSLLATYPTIESIDDARGRALRPASANVRDIEAGIEQLRKRKAELDKELASYGKRATPARLTEDLHQVELDLAAQAELLAAKQKDIEAINARYDDEKKRYADLTARRR